MRPKVVLMVLGLTVGLVALAAVLRAVLGGHGGAPGAGAGSTAGSTPEVTNASPGPVKVGASNTVAMTEGMRAAALAKELDLIRELQADGGLSPTTPGILLGKVTHPEKEVRKAALEALVSLNDTNVVPGLEQALTLIEDPREKVALMDAIEYLKLPSLDTLGSAGGQSQNPSTVTFEKAPKASHEMRAGKTRTRQDARPPNPPAAPAPVPQAQPNATTPDAAPPQ
jgi:hypothetical protein